MNFPVGGLYCSMFGFGWTALFIECEAGTISMISFHISENSNKESWWFVVIWVVPSSRLTKLQKISFKIENKLCDTSCFWPQKKRHKLVSLVWSNFVLRHSNNIFSLPQKSIMIQCNPPLIFMQLYLPLYFTWYNQGTVITQWPLFMSTFLLKFFSMKQNNSLQLFALQLGKYPPLPPTMRWVVVLVCTTQIPKN